MMTAIELAQELDLPVSKVQAALDNLKAKALVAQCAGEMDDPPEVCALCGATEDHLCGEMFGDVRIREGG